MIVLQGPHALDLVGELLNDQVRGLSETGVELLLIFEEVSHLFYGIQICASKNLIEEVNEPFLQ